MQFDDEDLNDIATAVWDSLCTSIEPGPASDDAQLPRSGCVKITGAWSGHVVLDTSEASLRAIAASMFDIGPAEVAEDHLEDALAELTNMVGGNIKCLLEDGESKLSLPEVSAKPEGEPEQVAWFADPEGPVRIRVFGA